MRKEFRNEKERDYYMSLYRHMLTELSSYFLLGLKVDNLEDEQVIAELEKLN